MKVRTIAVVIALLLTVFLAPLTLAQAKHSAAWYKTHKRHSAAWYKKHPRKHSAAWYKKHPRKHSAAWYKKHPKPTMNKEDKEK